MMHKDADTAVLRETLKRTSRRLRGLTSEITEHPEWGAILREDMSLGHKVNTSLVELNRRLRGSFKADRDVLEADLHHLQQAVNELSDILELLESRTRSFDMVPGHPTAYAPLRA